MNRTKILAIVMTLGLSASLYACGSDDDSGGTAGAAGKAGGGGSSGKGGSGGTGGSGGKGGGTAGGNTAGKGGSMSDAGAAGSDISGDSGAGGDSGLGAAGSGDSGAGGEGGAPSAPVVLTLNEACTAACDPAHTLASCSTALAACITACESYPGILEIWAVGATDAARLNQEYLTAITCMAEHLPNTNQYACASGPAVNVWSPVAATVCEAALCKWTCDDVLFTSSIDENVSNRCHCT